MTTEREFNRYTISVFDFEDACKFATAAKRHPINSAEYEGLLLAAVVAYARPFSRNEIHKEARAERSIDIERLGSLSVQECEFHQSCMKLRNKAVAHSSFDFNPTRFDPTSGVISSKAFSLPVGDFDVDALIGLAKKLVETLHHQRAEYVRSNRK